MAKSDDGGRPTTVRPHVSSHKLDWSTILGFVIGVGSLWGGLKGDGGKLKDVLHLESLLIVFGATLGATLVATSHSTVKDVLGVARLCILTRLKREETEVAKLRRFARQLRSRNAVTRPGMLSKHSFGELVFLNDPDELWEITPTQLRFWNLRLRGRELQISAIDECLRFSAGAAPTFGVAGAIFGLMHVVHNLHGDVGLGIAQAFTATIYGVFLTNFVLLPAAEKIGNRLRIDQHFSSFMLHNIETLFLPAEKEACSTKPARHLLKEAKHRNTSAAV